MLVSARILGKFSREYENVSLRKIAENISNGSHMQYAEKKGDDVSRRRRSENYPVYDAKKDKKTSKHLAINREEYLTLVLHLFKSYVEVYRIHDLKELLLSDDTATGSGSNIGQYKNVHQKVQNEKNHRLDYGQIIKEWKQLKTTAKTLASTDMIPVVPLVECRNVYLEPSDLVRYQEDLEYLVKLKEIVDGNVQLGNAFKKWRTVVAQFLST